MEELFDLVAVPGHSTITVAGRGGPTTVLPGSLVQLVKQFHTGYFRH